MSEKKKIKISASVQFKGRAGVVVEITRKQYEELGARLDARPRGFERERLAEEIMEVCGIDLRHADYSDFEVDDFCEV